MVKPLREVRERLLRAGVAPRHVRRYLNELEDHFADLKAEEEGAGLSPLAAEAVALKRLGAVHDLTAAMVNQRQFQSWCVRAPWAAFAIGPVFALAVAWLVSLFILWSGWQIFMPGEDTPFIRMTGISNLAIVYFVIGRLLFFTAPIFIGWIIGAIAVRQRYLAMWPFVGLMLLAWIGGTAHVQASRSEVHGGFGHISMNFTIGDSVQSISGWMLHVVMILAITTLPYLIGQVQKAYFSSS